MNLFLHAHGYAWIILYQHLFLSSTNCLISLRNLKNQLVKISYFMITEISARFLLILLQCWWFVSVDPWFQTWEECLTQVCVEQPFSRSDWSSLRATGRCRTPTQAGCSNLTIARAKFITLGLFAKHRWQLTDRAAFHFSWCESNLYFRKAYLTYKHDL